MKFRNLKKGDIVIIAAVILTSALLFLCLNLFSGSVGDYAEIKVNGEKEAVLPLQMDTVYEVKLENGNSNTVIIKDGFAEVTEASCPDKICVNHKKINKSGESIICLPNRVEVTIVSNSDEGIDGVVQ